MDDGKFVGLWKVVLTVMSLALESIAAQPCIGTILIFAEHIM